MKKILMSVLFLGMAATGLFAQEGKKKMRGHKGHGMHQELNLTEEQKSRMKAVNENFRKSMMDLRKKEDITVGEQRSQMEQLRKKHREEMSSLLTKEQKESIKKMKADRKAASAINEKARMEKMKLRLGLTDDQVNRLSQQNAEMSSKMKALKENKSISEEKRREEMRSIMKQRKENLKSILTEEQMKKLEQGQKKRGAHAHKKKRIS